jgi:hypothetical protein
VSDSAYYYSVYLTAAIVLQNAFGYQLESMVAAMNLQT